MILLVLGYAAVVAPFLIINWQWEEKALGAKSSKLKAAVSFSARSRILNAGGFIEFMLL